MECDNPLSPENGYNEKQGIEFGDSIKHGCDIGHRMEGNPIITCQKDGTWSEEVPVCKREYIVICYSVKK